MYNREDMQLLKDNKPIKLFSSLDNRQNSRVPLPISITQLL